MCFYSRGYSLVGVLLKIVQVIHREGSSFPTGGKLDADLRLIPLKTAKNRGNFVKSLGTRSLWIFAITISRYFYLRVVIGMEWY